MERFWTDGYHSTDNDVFLDPKKVRDLGLVCSWFRSHLYALLASTQNF